LLHEVIHFSFLFSFGTTLLLCSALETGFSKLSLTYSFYIFFLRTAYQLSLDSKLPELEFEIANIAHQFSNLQNDLVSTHEELDEIAFNIYS
jgi:hypothetical protein